MNATLGAVVPLAMFKSDLSLTMIRRVAIIVWVVAVERGIKNENLWGREKDITMGFHTCDCNRFCGFAFACFPWLG